jgi:hypothetical protein
LWFWGSGTLPDWVRSAFQQVLSPQPALRSLARIGTLTEGTPDLARLDAILDLPGAQRSVIVDLADLREAPALLPWFERADAALRRSEVARVELVFESGQRFGLRAGQRWRVWRRPRELDA